MDFDHYQGEVRKYDATLKRSVVISLMGLCGEIGEINAIFKKRYRDRDEIDYPSFAEDLREELGDALWYLTSVCNHLGLKLSDVVNENLRSKKLASRTQVCDKFPDYQDKVTKGPRNRQHLLSCLSKNAANLFKIYTEAAGKKREEPSFRAEMVKEIGDIFWDLTNIAAAWKLQMGFVAYTNLEKVRDIHAKGTVLRFDKDFPAKEKFPRKMEVEFRERKIDGEEKVELFYNGKPLGDGLDDNSANEDYYRFHDAFHLAYLAVLGWSPVVRALLKKKRKSDSETDRIQDGARAGILEEAVSLYVFTEALRADSFENAKAVDLHILKIIKELTRGLEVTRASHNQWQDAILQGYAIFRELVKHRQGVVKLDLDKGTISFERLRGKRAPAKRK